MLSNQVRKLKKIKDKQNTRTSEDDMITKCQEQHEERSLHPKDQDQKAGMVAQVCDPNMERRMKEWRRQIHKPSEQSV